MSAVTTRDALTEAIGAWQADAALLGADLDFDPTHLADRLLASGAVWDANGLIAEEIVEDDPTLTVAWTRTWLMDAADDFDRADFMNHVERMLATAHRVTEARVEAVLAAHSVARFNVSHHHVGAEACPLPDDLTSDCPERRLECRCGEVMPHPAHRTHVAAIVMREAAS